MGPKRDALEVKSGSIEAELIEIKERLGSLETIAGLANSREVLDHAGKHLTSEQRFAIMRLCEIPQTKEQLRTALNHNSIPALDKHLKPLREADLIHQSTNDEGLLTFEWSKLFKSVPKSSRSSLLLGTPNANKAKSSKS
jgi:DNA-binding transcriptional ArsR family regulator